MKSFKRRWQTIEITIVGVIAALLLISWMEQNANFREEAISLQAKSKAQQESIEALSAAYAQQRKLTHDFRAHLSTLDGMLMQQNRDINTIQTYIHSLQSKQTERILLVNTHHAALDALLNQKALVAKNRKIDIQFSVNDLSPIKIDMVDLTVVISNTLDNAIEACEKLPETDRQIYVQALLEESQIPLVCSTLILPPDEEPLMDAWSIRDQLEHQIELILDAGGCGWQATTVIDLTTDTPTLIRMGGGNPRPFGIETE